MRALVVGGTGRTGSRVVEELLKRGYGARALGRSAEARRLPPGAQPVRADVLDELALRRAMAGCDAVVVALSIPRASPSPFAPVVGPPDLHSRSTALILETMSSLGVRRLVKLSAQGVGDSAPRAGFWFRVLVAVSNLGPAFADHARADELVQASEVDWTVLRPPVLDDHAPRGWVHAGEDLVTSSFDTVSRGDVARVAVDALEQPGWTGRCLTVAPSPPRPRRILRAAPPAS